MVCDAKCDAVESQKENKKEGHITTGALREILETQGYKCALSGDELTPDACSLDHKQPLSKGGSHTIDNVQLVTPEINRMKGSMTMDEFILMCMKVATHMTGA